VQRTQVVYFSRTGYTRRIAEEIAAACGADVDPIKEPRDRWGIWGYFRSAREALKKRLVDIEPPTVAPSAYDLLIIGTPVWAGNVCSPVRSYIAAHKAELKRVAFFCTQAGSDADKVLEEMAALCGQTPIATAAFTDSQIKRGQHLGRLDQFIRLIAGATTE